MTPRGPQALTVVVLLLVVPLVGCLEGAPGSGNGPGGNGVEPPAEDVFRTVLAGSDGSYPRDDDERAWYERDRLVVLEHASEWAEVAEKLPGGTPLPPVNWSGERVLLAFVAHGSPCDAYRITDVRYDADGNVSVATVTRYEQAVGGCIAQVVYHYHAVAIPDRATPVAFQNVTVPWYPTRAGNWTLSDEIAQPWSPDDLEKGLLAPPEVNVTVDPATVPPDDAVVNVTVRNDGDRNLTITGTDCGLHLARESGIAWELLASAPGNQQESLRIVEPGGTCDATVDLASFHIGGSGATWDPAPGTYRLAIAGGWGDGDRRVAVVSFGLVTVT